MAQIVGYNLNSIEMNCRTHSFVFLILIFLQIIDCKADTLQEPKLLGKVELKNSQKILKDVKIFINDMDAVLSNDQGEFSISDYSSLLEPANVSAIKKGYEIAVWSFSKGNLTITMRPATIKTVEGRLLSVSGTPKAFSKISYIGQRTQEASTDKDGNFIIIIPYEDEVTGQDRFFVNNELTKIEQFSEDIDAAKIEVVLSELVAQSGKYKVVIKDESNNPVAKAIAIINGISYFTDANGMLWIGESEISPDLTNWKIDGYQTISTKSAENEKSVVVIMKKLNPAQELTSNIVDSIQSAIQDTSQLRKYSAQLKKYTAAQLSSDIEKLEQFYSEKGAQFRKENERILSITDSLSKITVKDGSERSMILFHIDELNKSMISTTEAFNEINYNSLELIKILKLKLDEKDETIKIIEEEKVALITTISNNLTLFIAIVINFLLLLFIALLTIKRFKAQNKVIQRTKKQLINAQEIAKIGSMVYNFKNKCFTYSQNFFDTLRISNYKRIIRLQGRSEGQIFGDLINKYDRNRVIDQWNNGLSNGEPFSVEFKGRADDEKEIYLDMNTKFEQDTSGSIIGISSTLQDVSEKKESELLLVEAARKTEQASMIKEEFLSSMSHEIRTPLNAIIGVSELLVSEEPNQSQLKNLNIIHFSSQHLLALVNDILDFSKIRAGKVTIENRDFNVKDLVSGIINTMEFNAREKGISILSDIDSNIPSHVIGDELRINQVLTNLMGNAIKFTNTGTVTLSVTLVKSKKHSSEINFSVKDTGIGIAKDKLGLIFNSFEQENTSTAREHGGTGLGLAISKELVKFMGGGELLVKSTHGVGSEFYFSLPFEDSALVELDEEYKFDRQKGGYLQSNSDLKSLTGLKVLCVDDNEINILVISQYLKKWGLEATYAMSGEKALEAFRKNSFDLVFMDIRLPDMDGYEVSNAIHLEDPDRKVPIIALTADINTNTIERTREAGMVDFLGKPFKSEELKALIVKYALVD